MLEYPNNTSKTIKPLTFGIPSRGEGKREEENKSLAHDSDILFTLSYLQRLPNRRLGPGGRGPVAFRFGAKRPGPKFKRNHAARSNNHAARSNNHADHGKSKFLNLNSFKLIYYFIYYFVFNFFSILNYY